MSMVVAASLRPTVRYTSRPLGLGTTAYVLEDPTGPAPGGSRIELGEPAKLGALYARYPLLTLIGLLGLGWAGGYFTWLWLGRR